MSSSDIKFYLVFFGIIAAVYWLYHLWEGYRRGALAELAASLGLEYSESGGDERELSALTGLKVFRTGTSYTELRNRIVRPGTGGAPDIVYFDCKYDDTGRRSGARYFSLYLADFRDSRLPEFELVPKGLRLDVKRAFGIEKGIEVPEFPEFSSRYFLTGPYKDRVAALFRGGAARYFEGIKGLSAECSGRYLAFFVMDSTVSVSEVPAHMDAVLEMAEGMCGIGEKR